VPTIVFGYFALTFFTPVVYDDLLGMDVRTFNALSAGIIMGFMVLPTAASISEDAMSGSRRRWRQPSSLAVCCEPPARPSPTRSTNSTTCSV
jgi:phosphate transport system permease protein